MFSRHSQFIRRISLLLVIAQVVLSCWNGQPVLAQTDTPPADTPPADTQPAPTPPTTTPPVDTPPATTPPDTTPPPTPPNYSSNYAYVLTGQGQKDEQDPNYYVGNVVSTTSISADKSAVTFTDIAYQIKDYLGILDREDSAYITPPSQRPWYAAIKDLFTTLVMTPAQRAATSEDERFRQRLGHTATVLDNGKVLIVGGSNGAKPIWDPVLYDPTTGLVSPVTSDPDVNVSGRVFHTATKLANGDVLILGGQARGKNIQGKDEFRECDTFAGGNPCRYDGGIALDRYSVVYRVATNTFVTAESYFNTSLSTMTTLWPRAKQAAVLLSSLNKLLIVGGAAAPKTYWEEAAQPSSLKYLGMSKNEQCFRPKNAATAKPTNLFHGFNACWRISQTTLGANDTAKLSFAFSHEDLPLDVPAVVPASEGTVKILLTVKVVGDASIDTGSSSTLPTKTAQYYLNFPARSQLDKNFSIKLSPTDTNGDGLKSAQVYVDMRQWFDGEFRSYANDIEDTDIDLVVNQRWSANLIASPSTPSSAKKPKVLLVNYDGSLATSYVKLLKAAGLDEIYVQFLGAGDTRLDPRETGNPYLTGSTKFPQTVGTIYLTERAQAEKSAYLASINGPASAVGLAINSATPLKSGPFQAFDTSFATKELTKNATDFDAIIVLAEATYPSARGGSDAMAMTVKGASDDATGLGGELMDLKTGISQPIAGLPVSDNIEASAMADGRVMIVNRDDGQLYLFDPATKLVRQTSQLSDGKVHILNNPTDHKTYISADQLYVWDTSADALKALGQPKFSGGQAEATTVKILTDKFTSLLTIAQVGKQSQVAIDAYNKALKKLSSAYPKDVVLIQQMFGSGGLLLQDPKTIVANPDIGKTSYIIIPAGILSADYLSTQLRLARLTTAKYTADLGNGRYFMASPFGTSIWDINQNLAEVVYAPSRIPLVAPDPSAYTIKDIIEKDGTITKVKVVTANNIKTAYVVKGKSTMFAVNYDYAQVTSLPGLNQVLITGGMIQNGQNTRGDGMAVIGDAEGNVRALEANALGGAIGAGMVATGLVTLLIGGGIMSAMVIAAGISSFMIASVSSLGVFEKNPPGDSRCQQMVAPLSCFNIKPPVVYAHTAETNWLFKPDPFPNATDDGTQVMDINPERDMDGMGNYLPPREALAPSKPAPNQQVAGKNSGYKLELTFDKPKLNPYSGSTVTGTVRAVDASGRVVPMVGAVDLYVGAGNSKLNIGTATTANDSVTSFSASEYHTILGSLDNWSTKSQPSGTVLHSSYTSPGSSAPINNESDLYARSAGNGYVTSDAIKNISWLTTADGSNKADIKPSTSRPSSPNPFAPAGPVIILNNGVGTFTYQVEDHKYDNVTFAVTAQEQPIFPTRDSKYTGADLPNYGNGGEPTDVRNQRLSKPIGYQVVPVRTVSIPSKLVPDPTKYPLGTYSKLEPAATTSPIATVKTLKFADYKSSTPPVVTNEVVSKVGYSYDITTNAPLKPKKGDKFTITITPKPEAGKTLPADIYDSISIAMMNGYDVYNKNYQGGGFIRTVPALFAENSTINKAIPGGFSASSSSLGAIYFYASKDPVTLELEYTGEPSRTSDVRFNVKVTDNSCLPQGYRFSQRSYPGENCKASNAMKKTMHEIIALPFAQ